MTTPTLPAPGERYRVELSQPNQQYEIWCDEYVMALAKTRFVAERIATALNAMDRRDDLSVRIDAYLDKTLPESMEPEMPAVSASFRAIVDLTRALRAEEPSEDAQRRIMAATGVLWDAMLVDSGLSDKMDTRAYETVIAPAEARIAAYQANQPDPVDCVRCGSPFCDGDCPESTDAERARRVARQHQQIPASEPDARTREGVE